MTRQLLAWVGLLVLRLAAASAEKPESVPVASDPRVGSAPRIR